MPAISKIRFANVVYEGGGKRYNDEIFYFDGHNGAILLENGGGKTVFIQTALQAIIPHTDLADRKLLQTLSLMGTHAHIAIEWILQDKPRQYAVTVVTLFLRNEKLDSHKYVYTYPANDEGAIEHIPFSIPDANNMPRPASAAEMNDYYVSMSKKNLTARTFPTIGVYRDYLEQHLKIVASEWDSLATINSGEGDVEAFFENCRTTTDLVNRLLIPTVQKAIGGSGVGGFSDLFEGNRDNFRKNKQLKDQIEENKLIESELSGMMAGFERLELLEREQNNHKQHVKAIYNFVLDQKNEFDKKYKIIQINLENLGEAEKILKQEEDSLSIAELREHEQRANQRYAEVNLAHEVVNGELIQTKQELNNLKYLRDKQEYDRKLAQLKAEETRLETMDQQTDENELQENLQNVLAQLKDVYDDKERYLLEEHETIKRQIEKTKEDHTNLDSNIENKQIEISGVDKELVRLTTLSNALLEQKEQIACEILDDYNHQNVETESVNWSKKLSQAREHLAEQSILEQQKAQEKKELGELLELLREEIQKTELLKQASMDYLERATQEQKQLLLNLQGLFSIRNVSDVFLEQVKIETALEIEDDKKKKALEIARLRERISSRLQDSYGELDAFAADPWIRSLIKQSDRPIESGTDFAERLLKEKRVNKQELFKRFPFWQMCIVVQDEDKNVIERKIEESSGGLTFPLIVLSVQEARELVNQSFPLDTIIPAYWSDVVETEGFELWKRQIAEQARGAREAVSNCEDELNNIRKLRDLFSQFLQRYPHDEYRRHGDQKKKCENELRRFQADFKRLSDSLYLTEKTLEAIVENKQSLSELIYSLEYKTRKASEWQEKDNEQKSLKSQISSSEEELRLLQTKLSKMKSERVSSSRLLEDLEANRRATYDLISELKGEELYEELKQIQETMPALETELELKQKRLLYRERLFQVQKEKNVVVQQIREYEEDLERLTIILNEYDLVINETSFPADGQLRIRILMTQMSELEKQVNVKSLSLHEADLHKNTAETTLNLAIAAYDSHGCSIHVFEAPLEIVRERLSEKRKRLASERLSFERHEQNTKTEIDEFDKMLHLIDRNNIKFDFLSERTQQAFLSSEEKVSFNRDRMQYFSISMQNVEQVHKRVEIEKDSVNRSRRTFEQFVELKVKNEKMRQAALNGIRQRSSFGEMRDWEQGMKERITRATSIAEQGIQEFDKDLKHFIRQVHTYMKSICDELGNIEKMTRVKVDESYKSIIVITTPTWEEEIAKERLFRHVEWMSERLSVGEYMTDEGMEDTKKVRRDIERWLHPKHLLTRNK